MDWILTLKSENQIPNPSATPVLHKLLSPNLWAEPSSFTQSEWRLGWCAARDVTENRHKSAKEEAKTRSSCQTHSALSRHSTVQSGQAQSSVVNHSKDTPHLFFLCFWWNKMQQNLKKKNKHTALRDKSAQNCAKTSPKTTVRPLLFKNSSMISTRRQLPTTDLFKIRVWWMNPSEMLTVWTPNYNGKKRQDIFLKVGIFRGVWRVLASFSRAAQRTAG